MSGSTIEYGTLGDACGIFTSINSGLTTHLVCADGLACINLENSLGVMEKKCRQIAKGLGESCNPQSYICYGGRDCKLSALNTYTCGGVTPDGNSISFTNANLISSNRDLNWTLIISGLIIIMLSVFIFYLFIVYFRTRKNDDDLFESEKTPLVQY